MVGRGVPFLLGPGASGPSRGEGGWGPSRSSHGEGGSNGACGGPVQRALPWVATLGGDPWDHDSVGIPSLSMSA